MLIAPLIAKISPPTRLSIQSYMQKAVARQRVQQEKELREATAQKRETRDDQQRRPIGVGAANADAHAGNAENNTAAKGAQDDADAHAGNAEDNTAAKGA